MKLLTKSKAYELLFKINKKQNIDVSKYVEILSKSGDEIPFEVILFINQKNGSELPQLKIYNLIYNKRRNNPLYENIMNESASPDDQCLAINSLITQCLLQFKKLPLKDRGEFLDIMNVSDLCNAVSSYLIEGRTDLLHTTFFDIRNVFIHLFKNNDNQ